MYEGEKKRYCIILYNAVLVYYRLATIRFDDDEEEFCIISILINIYSIHSMHVYVAYLYLYFH